MAITGTTFARVTILMLIAGALALLGIVGASLWLVSRTTDYSENIVREQTIRTGTSTLLAMVQAAETSQRGFLLTRDRAYLEPYERVRGRIVPQIEWLRAQHPEGSRARADIDRLNGIVADKMREMDETIRLTEAGQADDAIAIVRTDGGKQSMDEARQFLRERLNAVDRHIADSVASTRANAQALTWVVIAGALMIALFAIGSVWISLRYTRDLIAARAEVVELNFSLEERVADRTSELARANDEIQRFAYIVSHDLRAPLVNVMGFTSEMEVGLAAVQRYVEAGGPDAAAEAVGEARLAAFEDMPEALRFIRSSTTRMDGLINAILKLSREGRRTLNAERIDMGALMETAASSVQHRIQELGGSITVEKPVPNIMSDRLALEQIFGNLVDNAVKYLDPARPGRIVIRGREAGARVVFEVEDNGRGIAAQDLERIFELFRRSGAQDRPGEGIGLAHVRTLARRIGGDVTVESDLGHGTVFRVVLPRRADGFTARPDAGA